MSDSEERVPDDEAKVEADRVGNEQGVQEGPEGSEDAEPVAESAAVEQPDDH